MKKVVYCETFGNLRIYIYELHRLNLIKHENVLFNSLTKVSDFLNYNSLQLRSTCI